MPYLKIDTNVSLSYEQKESLMAETSKLLSQLLQKPEAYVMVSLRSGATMMMGGTTDPCAYLAFKSLGLPESSTAVFSSALCKLLHAMTGIDPSRIYIEFTAPERHLWGWNNATF
ncbi:MAG: hypothetical protein HON68_02150 [Gammaproteobacteria bacterium]|jgi:phenylpyruvate tautomerase PptA (4-oxalocrotonate tautomerase family)|nr:hypothetical protein [Gammaproteobacteria bacterium]MBT3490291.1 hypothetical protein [Gammaproteobacteria bacterium]MBT3717628.1 hypothetical protein [Gammaproteobacteria bacterium]MBT3843579.1 hypothetical protein [Gammaproteobacteria bacterium]MBT3893817.1 hypothetical protein [Gammaproteobacteria bacterium]